MASASDIVLGRLTRTGFDAAPDVALLSTWRCKQSSTSPSSAPPKFAPIGHALGSWYLGTQALFDVQRAVKRSNLDALDYQGPYGGNMVAYTGKGTSPDIIQIGRGERCARTHVARLGVVQGCALIVT